LPTLRIRETMEYAHEGYHDTQIRSFGVVGGTNLNCDLTLTNYQHLFVFLGY